MAVSLRRRINTVGIELFKGTIMPSSAQVLLPKIIRETYGIQDSDLYGVALNGGQRIFVKLLSATVYESLVTRFQDISLSVTPAVSVRMVDVSRHYTWIKLRNVPFEADEADIRKVFETYETVHYAQHGTWVAGAYAGFPEGSFNLKMTLRHPIPSYVYLQDFRTQVMVMYPGQRHTCRLCGEYDHIAATCDKRRRVPGPAVDVAAPASKVAGEKQTSDGGRGVLWSEIVDRAHRTGSELESLPQLPDQVSSPVDKEEQQLQEKVLEIEEELVEVLKTLSPPERDVTSEHGVIGESSLPESRRHDSLGRDGSLESSVESLNHSQVEVEVHREATSDQEMCNMTVTRKRAATSDTDDVLTPAQWPGKQTEVKCEGSGVGGGSHDRRHQKKGGGKESTLKVSNLNSSSGVVKSDERKQGWKL
ncbi:uncharacterized protein [Cherax quadricarinatus]|uniref:uncharacterized protein n=1 Tax=Cherax quadricarinatus TaxID=27406 RepID=UPI00387E95DF